MNKVLIIGNQGYIGPVLQKHLSKDILRFAINMEYVSENHNLNQNDEIAIFPPVSGG